MRLAGLLCLTVLTAACSREPGVFVDANARAHVGMLAGTIGSRPVGSAANERARHYLADQLKQTGFEVRVQQADARRHEMGQTARVSNIIAVIPGQQPAAIGLVAHYDSSPSTPGAADDALGVGVVLEAARLFAARAVRRWSLFVLLTDGEERDLMGAAALSTDREVMNRLRAYVNLDAIGSSGNALLFEAGPGNGWLVSPWARRAPHPRGGSYIQEIYQRLPNDTDFSILKTRDIPGLNFAPVGDSFAYHTPRDTPERLAYQTVRQTGENVVAILDALEATDITQRARQAATFFDIGGTVGVSYGPVLSWAAAALALLLGVVAWVRLTADAVRRNGVLRWVMMFLWGWLGAALTAGAMVAATWLLRLAREVYHPWYARPGRLFLLLIVTGVAAGWGLARIGRWLPGRAHVVRHPGLTWTIALPAWIALAALGLWFAPSAAYLWTLPLLGAGLLPAVAPARIQAVVRTASLIALAAAATLWLRDTHDLLWFVVAMMGRLPVITPAFAYAGLLCAAGVMLVPPLIALLTSDRPLARPWTVTTLLLLALAGATGAAYVAPAYTFERPLRRHVRALQDVDRPGAIWEVASVEPGLDLGSEAPDGWMPTSDTASGMSVPWGRFTFPFVFRTTGPPLGEAPVAVSGFALSPVADGTHLTLAVVPRALGLTVSFVLPPGLTPARTSLPGVERFGRWTAIFVAPPPEGIAWEATFSGAVADKLRDTRITVTASLLPDGDGWQRLPAWLPQENAVWSAAATWVVPATAAPSIAPVPPLR